MRKLLNFLKRTKLALWSNHRYALGRQLVWSHVPLPFDTSCSWFD